MRFFWLALVLSIPMITLSQVGGTLRLRVVDEDGRGIADAQVWVDAKTSVSNTGASGIAEFNGLAAGSHLISARHLHYAAIDSSVLLSAAGAEVVQLTMMKVVIELPAVTVVTEKRSIGGQHFERLQLEQSGAATVSEFLTQHGYDLRADGGEGSTATARIGGSNANQVAVYLDGQRMNSAASGTADLSSVSLDAIEDIHVYRGAVPEMSGEGIGGVIQLTSRNLSRTPAMQVGTDIYSYRQRVNASRTEQLGNITGKIDYVGIRGAGDYRYRLSVDDVQGELDPQLEQEYRRVNNAVNRDQFAVHIQSNQSQLWEFSGAGNIVREDRGMPGYLVPNLTPDAHQESQTTNCRVAASRRIHSMKLRSQLNTRRESRHYTNPTSPFTKESKELGSSDELSSDVLGKVLGFETAGGVLWGREELGGTSVRSGQAIRWRSEYWSKVNREQRLSNSFDLKIRNSAAVRYARSGTTDYVSPRMESSVSHEGDFSTGLSASWGRSFRTPDLYSMFWLEDQFATGNPDLQPERSQDWFGETWFECGEHEHTSLRITVSDQQVDQLVVWRPSFDGKWKPVNVPSASLRSLQVNFSQTAMSEHLTMSGGADWTEARDRGNDRTTAGKYLTFRSPRTFYSGISGRSLGWTATANFRYVDRRAATESNTKWLDDYRIVDLLVQYRLDLKKSTVEFHVGVSNGLNSDYRLVRHAPMPLREIHLGINLHSTSGSEL